MTLGTVLFVTFFVCVSVEYIDELFYLFMMKWEATGLWLPPFVFVCYW